MSPKKRKYFAWNETSDEPCFRISKETKSWFKWSKQNIIMESRKQQLLLLQATLASFRLYLNFDDLLVSLNVPNVKFY